VLAPGSTASKPSSAAVCALDKPAMSWRATWRSAAHDQPPPANLIEQRRGNRDGAGGGKRDGQQPRLDLPPAGGGEVAEAVGCADGVELLVTRLSAGAVGGERGRHDADLVGDEA
jgi:hypothetical protein